MQNLRRKGVGLGALSSVLLLLNNCASDETIKEAITQKEPESEKATQLSVNAMVVADPPPLAVLPPVPIVPVIPIAPILPPPPPPVIIPPDPFLWQASLVPPEQASLAASKGQLPSRHGDRTFLYSFVNRIKPDDHHRHRRNHDSDDD